MKIYMYLLTLLVLSSPVLSLAQEMGFEQYEPNTATLTCECFDEQSGLPPVSDEDTATFDCVGCDVDVDKQVSCDGGMTWYDAGYADGVVDMAEVFPGSIDGEGLPTRRHLLLEAGVPRHRLASRLEAQLYDEPTRGGARRAQPFER